MGLWICSRPWREAAHGIDGWLARWWVRWMAAYIAICRVRIPYRELLWAAYLGEANSVPQFWKDENATASDSGIPPLLMLKMSLAVNWNKSDSDALDTPLAQAIWEHCAWLASQGNLNLITERDREVMEELRKRRGGNS